MRVSEDGGPAIDTDRAAMNTDVQVPTATQTSTRAADVEPEKTAVHCLAEKVAHVGSAIAHEVAMQGSVDVVLDEAIRTLGARCAYLHLADETQQSLQLVGSRALPESVIEGITYVTFDAPLPTARAASTRQAQFVTSSREVSLPLLADTRLVGVLTLVLDPSREPTLEERAALDECAEIFAFSIANATAFEEERRLHTMFEALTNASVAIVGELEMRTVLRSIVDEAREIAGAEYASLGIVVSDERRLAPWVYSGMTHEQEAILQSVAQRADLTSIALEAQPLRVADIRRDPRFVGLHDVQQPIVSLLGVPVLHGGRHVGTLCVANKRGASEFTLEDQRAVELLAPHAGAAIHQSQLRERLEAERARLSAILQSAPYGVHFVEAGTERIIANAYAFELAGQSNVATLDDYRGEVCTPDGKRLPKEQWLSRRVLRGEAVDAQELLVRTPDGREVPLLASAAPVFGRDGQIEGVVVVYDDITRLKELQRLRHEWASLVAHDLRQPLNVITLYVNMLQEMGESPDPRVLGRGLAHMLKASQALNRMISDLMDVSGIEAKALVIEQRPVDLAALASEAVERQRALWPDRQIQIRTDGRASQVNADPVRIGQVLDNLLMNALKYSASPTPVEVVVRATHDEVRVSVTNRGPGIAAEDLPRVFDRYFRSARARESTTRGLGLGLFIVKGLIEAHGGCIWAESTPGETTTFQFTLPSMPTES